MLKRFIATERTLKLTRGVLQGDRASLSQAITLIESANDQHKLQAEYLLDKVLAQSKNTNEMKSFRLGIAGPPGAGKSTFIESLGKHLISLHHKVAVLAIDPSSSISGGSILGDKTRMHGLATAKNAFVRPSPSRGILGGVAQHTNDIVLLCEGAGYDTVIVESVGLGQSEIVMDDTVDMLMLLVPPSGGDELQGSKKGIVEIADMVVVNKADGELKAAATHSAADFKRALQLVRKKSRFWEPKVQLCSALHNVGITEIWNTVMEFQSEMTKNGSIANRRGAQRSKWMWNQCRNELMQMVSENTETARKADTLRKQLISGSITPRRAAKQLIAAFSDHLRS